MQIKLVWCAYKATSLSHVHTLQTSISFFKQSIFVRFKSIPIPFGEHVCMYLSVQHRRVHILSVPSSHTQGADHENVRGFLCLQRTAM